MTRATSTLPADWTVTRPLGDSDVRIGRLGLGLREIGRDPDRTRAMLLRAVELGVRYLDTAASYGLGISEERLGETLPSLGRDRLVISTKVGIALRPPDPRRRAIHALSETITGGVDGRRAFADRVRRVLARPARTDPNQRVPPATPPSVSPATASPPRRRLSATCDYSYDGALRSLEGSLARLKTDHVDLVYIHDPEMHYRQALRGTYRALERLRRDGTVGAIGVGMNQTRMLRRFAEDGDFDVFLLAGRYSLLDQSAAEELFPITTARGISVVLAGVFNGGVLADPVPGASFDYAPAPDAVLAHAGRLRAVCERHGVSLRAAALAFSFAHPAVHTLLLGSTSAAELEESIAMLQAPIPPELWVDLRAEGLLREDVPVPG